MPKFSQDSFTKLSTCHMDLQVLFYEVIKGYDCTVLEGHRGQKEQDEAFAKGNSKLKYPNGKHNGTPSMAVDVAPFIPNQKLDWKDSKRFYFFAGYVLGIADKLKAEGKMTHSIRYGGDWNGNHDLNDQTFFDLVHFELH